MGGLSYEEGIIHYYLFQKKLLKYMNKLNKKEDKYKLREGYIINPEWIDYWKYTIDYDKIKKYLDGLKINKSKLEFYKYNIKLYIERNIDEEDIKKISNTVKTNNFDIIHKNIFSQKFLMNFMNEKTYKSLKINDKTTKIKIKYIFKKKMIIFVLDEYQIIKIIIPDISYFTNNKNVVNLSWNFYDHESYKSKLEFLIWNDSEKIMSYLIDKGIFATPSVLSVDQKSKYIYILINEELIKKEKYENKNNFYNYYSKKTADKDLVIKQPKDINFDLAKRPSFRGLENVGATCYMNATLQCLVNIKPITDYLLNANKYCEIYDNVALCPLTLQYCQVLFGLFCDKSDKGYYTPKLFKTVIGEMNPLFEGVQANDSKDLIIFLLEVMNTELSKLHNKSIILKKKKRHLY